MLGLPYWTTTKPLPHRAGGLLYWSQRNWSWQSTKNPRELATQQLKIADALLSGYAGDCTGECEDIPVVAPHWGACTNCFTAGRRTADVSELKITIDKGFEELTAAYNSFCLDIMDMFPVVATGNPIHTGFSDAVFTDESVQKDDSCPHGCPNPAQPFCRLGHCISPTCADAAQFCHRNSRAGQVARVVCPFTCGCQDVTSSLLRTDAKDGCPAGCSDIRAIQLSQLPCNDASPGDVKLAAFAVKIAETSIFDSLDTARRLIKTGCAELKPHLCHLFDAKASDFKSLEPFCPGLA